MNVITSDQKSNLTPQEVISAALDRFHSERIAISFSGAEDVVLIDMTYKLVDTEFQVFCLDTGRLHEETYAFIDQVRDHYTLGIEVLTPDNLLVEELVHTKGLFSFYRDGHTQCCGVRKIDSLERKLDELDAWITGQRRDQGTTRTEVAHEEKDTAFSTEDHLITKFNPLAAWTSEDVWQYIRENKVPYNSLHDQGYKSIGCAPCTRPIQDGEPERAGRWWWENEDDKECGLHAQNLVSSNQR